MSPTATSPRKVPLSAISPCDCSVLPMSPREAEVVFRETDEELREVMDRARVRGGAFCPKCHAVFDSADCGG